MYKAWFIMKGFDQKKDVEFEDFYSPVLKMSSIRVALGLAAHLNIEVKQLDVKIGFLHGDSEDEIYMQQPKGFKFNRKKNLVFILKKSLYRIKQVPRQWYKKF